MALGDLPSVKQQFPDEAHEALRRYVDTTTVSVDDLAVAMQALAMLANTFFSALDASLADRAKLRTDLDTLTARVAALEARALVGTTGQLTKTLPALLGSVTNFDVVFRNPMPSTDYIPLVTLDNASVAVLGAVTVQLPVTAKTKAGCTVTVRNTALLTVASSVTVQVAALQLA